MRCPTYPGAGNLSRPLEADASEQLAHEDAERIHVRSLAHQRAPGEDVRVWITVSDCAAGRARSRRHAAERLHLARLEIHHNRYRDLRVASVNENVLGLQVAVNYACLQICKEGTFTNIDTMLAQAGCAGEQNART